MKLGLTGGIGCGKTTVVGIFSRMGWKTVQSDALVRGLLDTDVAVQKCILKRWGEQVAGAESVLDRAAIARIVFNDRQELAWLEQTLHPRVRSLWEAEIVEAKNRDILVEIPLLFEKRLETAFDLTVCVSSPSKVVLERMKGRGYSEDDVHQRRAHQLPLPEKVQRADYVISNAGSIEFLEEQISRLIESIRR